MDDPTVIVISDPPGPEQHSESLSEPGTEAAVENVATVADEILVEVKECQTRLGQLTADLATLRSEDAPANRSALQECLTEIKTLRLEQQALLAELKDLRQELPEEDSPLSIPSTLDPETIAPIVEPEEGAAPVESAPKKKKRYRI